MTIEQQLETLKKMRNDVCEDSEDEQALCYAIQAIEALADLQPTCNQLATDCISRQAAIDVLISFFGLSVEEEYGSAIQEVLNGLPSAQPEIIRCKDCRWYGRADKRRFYRGMDCLQKRIDTIIPDKDFCSRAERREE